MRDRPWAWVMENREKPRSQGSHECGRPRYAERMDDQSEGHRRERAILNSLVQTLPFFVVFLEEKHPARASVTSRVLLCTLGERRG